MSKRFYGQSKHQPHTRTITHVKNNVTHDRGLDKHSTNTQSKRRMRHWICVFKCVVGNMLGSVKYKTLNFN